MPLAIRVLLCVSVMWTSPAAIAASPSGHPSAIEVFTAAPFKITGQDQGVAIFELDGLSTLEQELSAGLPADPEEAKRQALERISDLGEGLRARAKQATSGLSLAQRYGIKKLPAVVFDRGRSVVYGVTDLDRAIALYRQEATP